MADKQEISGDESAAGAPHKGNTGKLIAVVVVITLLAILLVPSQDTPEQTGPGQSIDRKEGQAPSLLSPQQATLEQTAESPAQTTTPSAPPREFGPGGAARALVRELRSSPPPDLERAFAAGQRFQREGKLDDAYLMYFFAAREGHAPAAMELAREADPATFREGGLFSTPDELQANKWYERARAGDIPEAAEALAKLRSRVEQAALAGDQRARRIMLQWK